MYNFNFFKTIYCDDKSLNRVLRLLKKHSCIRVLYHFPIPKGDQEYVCVGTELSPTELRRLIDEDVKNFSDVWVSDGGAIRVALRTHFCANVRRA